MEISKRSKPQPHVQDRLSELPDSVIFHILWFVPMHYVVRTTVLSKRWRNLWTTIPFLNFDFDYDDNYDNQYDSYGIRNFVNRVLLRWIGIRILKFKVDLTYEIRHPIYSDSELWVNFAKERGVKEFYLHMWIENIHDFEGGGGIYLLPQCLYSCSSLEVLSFEVCYFRINGNVQWNQLKSLTFTQCFGVTQHLINQILSGSPHLEVLNLCFVDGGENLNIRSNSLKELLICKHLYRRHDIYLVSELTIWTPNLKTLKIDGIPYTNCRLTNVSSLTQATIGFYGLTYDDYDDCDFPGIDLESGFLSSQDYIGEKYFQTLQTIQHVESITLFYCCLKVLGAMKMRCMHSSFPNVKSLKIGCCYDNYEQLVGLLEIFPRLQRLVLENNKQLHYKVDQEALKYEANIPKSFLLQLRTIEVTWINGDNVFPLIEILLKYASKLEKLVFLVDRISSRDALLLASNKLMNMPRSSTNCIILLGFCPRDAT